MDSTDSSPSREQGSPNLLVFIVTNAVTVLMISSGVLGLVPQNPLTSPYQKTIEQSFPPEFVGPVNAYLGSIGAPPISDAKFPYPGENSGPDPVGWAMEQVGVSAPPTVAAPNPVFDPAGGLLAAVGLPTPSDGVPSSAPDPGRTILTFFGLNESGLPATPVVFDPASLILGAAPPETATILPFDPAGVILGYILPPGTPTDGNPDIDLVGMLTDAVTPWVTGIFSPPASPRSTEAVSPEAVTSEVAATVPSEPSDVSLPDPSVSPPEPTASQVVEPTVEPSPVPPFVPPAPPPPPPPPNDPDPPTGVPIATATETVAPTATVTTTLTATVTTTLTLTAAPSPVPVGHSLTSVDLNTSGSNSVTVLAGSLVTVDFQSQIWGDSSACVTPPGCAYYHLVFGLENTYKQCYTLSNPGDWPGGTGPSGPFTFNAPSIPGTYSIYSLSGQYGTSVCDFGGIADYEAPDAVRNYVGQITVASPPPVSCVDGLTSFSSVPAGSECYINYEGSYSWGTTPCVTVSIDACVLYVTNNTGADLKLTLQKADNTCRAPDTIGPGATVPISGTTSLGECPLNLYFSGYLPP